MDGRSLNINQERLEALRSLMPDLFSEGKIDFDRLRQTLGSNAFAPPEHYELTWAGKADARREIQRQTSATLTPDRDQSIDFGTTQNVFIEGENLEVLRILQRAYFGKVKMIYIDPPYNTGNDSFVYPDDYAERRTDYQQRAGLVNENGYLNKLDLVHVNRPENGQFHSAWMSMMYPRLFLARNLLREDGVIFISIDDNEMNNLKGMMDEIFGEENFMSSFVWKRRQNADNRNQSNVSVDHEYLLAYCKFPTSFAGRQIDIEKYSNPDNDERGPWASIDLSGLATKENRPNLHYDIVNPKTGFIYPPNPDRGWSKSQNKIDQMIAEGKILFPKRPNGRPREKKFLNDLNSSVTGFSSVLDNSKVGFTTNGTKELDEIFGERIFPFPKNSEFIKNLVEQGSDSNDIILDFFAGSATTADAVLQLNAEDGGSRRFVLVQLPEPTDPKTEARKAGYDTIADIGRERVRRVIARMHSEIAATETILQNLTTDITTNDAAITELRAKTPELFTDTTPPKPLQRLLDEADRLRQKHTATIEKLTRLQETDKGFQAFRLAPSNFQEWRTEVTDKAALEQLLIDYTRSDKEGAESERMLYEFLLKKGYPLTAHIEELDLGGVRAYSVENGQMLVLLDGYNQAINDRIIETSPKHVVCLDRLFAGNDEALTNLHLDLRDRNIELSVI